MIFQVECRYREPLLKKIDLSFFVCRIYKEGFVSKLGQKILQSNKQVDELIILRENGHLPVDALETNIWVINFEDTG